MTRQLYLDGKPVATPVVTDLEANLLARLAKEDFGDSSNQGLVSVRSDDLCGEGGLERIDHITWDGPRQQLGAVITGLQRQNLVAFDEDDYGGMLWFDCEALRKVAAEHDRPGHGEVSA